MTDEFVSMYNIFIGSNHREFFGKGNGIMASIFDTAKYILEKHGALTTMKLQKLCYYSQAWHLAWYEEPMFEEEFEAWSNGPVCRELYSSHRGTFKIDAKNLPSYANIENLTECEKNTIDEVLSVYGDKSAHWLSELTHKERPWRETRANAGAKPGEPCDAVIPKETMLEYYAGL